MERRSMVIIGGGPAGYTAAMYAARAKLRPLCLEGYMPGGLIMTTGTVENYPGFADGVGGPELVMAKRAQAERFGAELVSKDVTEVDLSTWPFRVSWFGTTVEADTIIIATGATSRRLGLPSEDALDGRGVAYCAACDGAFFEDKRIAVVGGGDSAMDQAMVMSTIAREVVVVHRREEFRATEIMVDHARQHENITFLQPYAVEEILGAAAGRVTGIRVRDQRDGSTHVEKLDGVFVSIGHEPATELFQPYLEHDEHGYLRVTPGSTTTSIDGVFAAGDVHDRVYRQVVTAAGSGCMAALDAGRWLARRGGSRGRRTTVPSPTIAGALR